MLTASLSFCRMTGELGFDFWHVYIFKIAPRLDVGPTEPAAQCLPGVHSLGKLAGVWRHISILSTSSWRGA